MGERNIPHVLDIFVSSPGERRRIINRQREEEKHSRQLKDQQKSPSSDSAVFLCSSSDEDERNISKYFDYLDKDFDDTTSKKKINSKSSLEKGTQDITPKKEKINKHDCEKEIKQIERHLSMKKTIRKKMMRDLQQAFVEDPKEFQQDPASISPERKSNININNLTISKRRMSRSEHSFLEMLKENESRDIKSGRGEITKCPKNSVTNKTNRNKNNDSDSGNDSPTRSPTKGKTTKGNAAPAKEAKEVKDDKKITFWQRITGKAKSKR